MANAPKYNVDSHILHEGQAKIHQELASRGGDPLGIESAMEVVIGNPGYEGE